MRNQVVHYACAAASKAVQAPRTSQG
jgi:hypothetical protein